MCADQQHLTDLTDERWDLLQPVLPERTWRPGGPGRPPCDMRRIVNGILYVNKTGCQWLLVPKDFGHWSTIYDYCKRWRCEGVWARVMETLRHWGARLPRTQPRALCGQH